MPEAHDSDLPEPVNRPDNTKPPTPIPNLIDEVTKGYALGFSFTPLRGKTPVLTAWQNLPRADLSQVLEWAKCHNIGIRTGDASKKFIIDDDTPDGSAAQTLGLPPTPTVRTGGGGLQHYFNMPNQPLGNARGGLPTLIDVRGNGGQGVYPGSIHPDTGKAYYWEPGLTPDDLPFADLPESVIKMINSPAKREQRTNRKPAKSDDKHSMLRSSVNQILIKACRKVADAALGQRNDTLNREAFKLGKIVGLGTLEHDTAASALLHSALEAGLPEAEAAATIESGLNAGLAEPHTNLTVQACLKEEQPRGSIISSDWKRPTILISGGETYRAADEAQNYLVLHQPPLLFQQNGRLVRLGYVLKNDNSQIGVKTAPTVLQVDQTWLEDCLSQLVEFVTVKKNGELGSAVDCPAKVAATVIARVGDYPYPALAGVINTPTLRRDGTILATVGYDPASCLYLAKSGTQFPPIPASPARDDALAALSVLREVLKDFPFRAPADEVVALGSLLTTLVRPTIRTAPLFAFTAPRPASGKSLLADVVAGIATGRQAAVMSQGVDDNEDKKRMFSVLLHNDPVSVIDNVTKPIGSAVLCSMLTQDVYSDRILGASIIQEVPTGNTTWIATGNNMQFVGDITRRVMLCELDPKCEKPEERKFLVDLRKFVDVNRGRLVTAGLTILRGWHCAGMPQQNLSEFASFERWSEWIRSPLVWLGLPDPCETRSRLESDDPVRNELAALTCALFKECGNLEFSASQVIASYSGKETFLSALGQIGCFATSEYGKDSTAHQFRAAKKLGEYMHKYINRVENGLRIVKHGMRGNVRTYKIECVATHVCPMDSKSMRE